MGDMGVRDSSSWEMATLDPILSYDNEEEEDDDEVSEMLPVLGLSPSLESRRALLQSKPANTSPSYEPPKQMLFSAVIASKILQLKDLVVTTRDDFLELRQEASDLQEYSNAKIARVTRYLGVLAEKAHRLDLIAVNCEDRLELLRKEKKQLFNDLLTLKGNIRVFVRVRQQGESETSMPYFIPNPYTISIIPSPSDMSTFKEFQFDQVYGPQVGQGGLFQDLQSLMQSALDGYNVCIFACGPEGSGKTYTMEGPTHDRGVYFRTFEELFDLSNSDSTSSSKCLFGVTMFEIQNEQIRDLLLTESSKLSDTYTSIETMNHFEEVELRQISVDNPTEFARVVRMGSQSRRKETGDIEHACCSNMVTSIHVHFSNAITGEQYHSKLSMVDMAGDENIFKDGAVGKTSSSHSSKSLLALGDVLSAVTSKKGDIPYSSSKLTQFLSDSLGDDIKIVIILNISPSEVQIEETLSYLSFAESFGNLELSAGSTSSAKRWRDMVKEARKIAHEKAMEASESREQVVHLQKALNEMMASHGSTEISQKSDSSEVIELKNNVVRLMKAEQDQKLQLLERAAQMRSLELKVRKLEEMAELRDGLHEAQSENFPLFQVGSGYSLDGAELASTAILSSGSRIFEEELSKRDNLIELLHEENEKLFGHLTDKKAMTKSPKIASPDIRKRISDLSLSGSFRTGSVRSAFIDDTQYSRPKFRSGPLPTSGMALAKSDAEKVNTTPAGEYLTAALMDFNPENYDGPAAVTDAANKLLMLVLAAVIKAGAAREHEMLAEIRAPVFAFLRAMEARRALDTMLVSRVRILYIRSLICRSTELQSIRVPPVERFLEKARSSNSRTSSSGSSPSRSPVSSQHISYVRKDLLDEDIPVFKIHLKPEKRSKLSSIFLKFRGIDLETYNQHLEGTKLKETNEEARKFAIGNKKLAALFVHTPAGEIQRQIRAWVAESFEFLSLAGEDSVRGVAGQFELLSTAIMDGWMAGLGVPSRGSTDALGQLLSDYTKRVYMSQLQRLKDLASTLATEEAETLEQVVNLRSGLESIEKKRRKVMQQMRTEVALLAKEEGGSPFRTPSTASEDARVASLISLEDIAKQAEEIQKEALQYAMFPLKQKSLLGRLKALSERMSSLLFIDHPCAQKFVMKARKLIESIPQQSEGPQHSRSWMSDEILISSEPASSSGDLVDTFSFHADDDVIHWSVLQFNTGAGTPFIIKCGATSSLELLIKAQARVDDKTGKELVSVVPSPAALDGLSLEEIRRLLSHLPEAFCQLALARTAEGTCARYARLYRTLAIRVPALRSSIHDIDKDKLKDGGNVVAPLKRQKHARQSSDVDITISTLSH
ncbi:hypothetical protein O6H91_20G036500 [Diphasiastrum complanatum]|uniref:Uncharacterized protein n=1 Tax=Diphasiastrum complanatum TaxID=34168 RepID=A0ACC2AQH1_DIPCM|nr:hypothetical protein O6H91_20G036500 [Diphasiastrum complanatum]